MAREFDDRKGSPANRRVQRLKGMLKGYENRQKQNPHNMHIVAEISALKWAIEELEPHEAPPVDLDPFHWHEAADRTHLLSTLVDSMLGDHPVIIKNGDLGYLVEEIGEKLGALFQIISRKAETDRETVRSTDPT